MGNENAKNIEIMNKKYELGRVLGKGSFGKVYALVPPHFGKDKESKNKLFAMKQMEKRKIIDSKIVNNILNEKRLLVALCNAPFVVHIVKTFQTSEDLCLVVDFMAGGDLRYHLDKNKNFSEEETRFYSSQVVLALEYLHGHGVIHRDVKPDNLLLDEDGYCNLADFNVSVKGLKGHTSKCGTPHYMAPEVHQKTCYDECVDWWSLGITIYEMLIGTPPFHSQADIQEKDITFPDNFSETAKSLILGLCTKNPQERLDVLDIKDHPFFKKIKWVDMIAKKYTSPYVPDKQKAHCNPDHELDELFAPIKKTAKVTPQENEKHFKTWDWTIQQNTQHKKLLIEYVRKGELNFQLIRDILIQLPVDSPLEDDYKRTALHIAAAENQQAIVQFLIDTKAEISVKDERRWTPLHEAANAGNYSILQLLFQNGADPYVFTYQRTLPLHYIVCCSFPPKPKTRTPASPQINNQDDLTNPGSEAADISDSTSREEEAITSEEMEKLLDALSGDGKWVNHLNDSNESVLHYACTSVHDTLYMVKYLVKKGANINVFSKFSNRQGQSPLHRAVMRKRIATIEFLLESGAKVGDSPDSASCTALFAAAKGNQQILSLLEAAKTKQNL